MIEAKVKRPFISSAGVGRRGSTMLLPAGLARSLAEDGFVELPDEVPEQTKEQAEAQARPEAQPEAQPTKPPKPGRSSRRKRTQEAAQDGDAPAGEGSPPDRG